MCGLPSVPTLAVLTLAFSLRTECVDIPTYFQAAPGDGRVLLSWRAEGSPATYQVKRGRAPSGPFLIVSSNVATASFVDTNVQNGATYFYAISAVADGVESAETARLRAVPSSPVLDWLPPGAK